MIWILWFDGWDNATELHHRCLESWRIYNEGAGWQVKAISRQEIPELLGKDYPDYRELRVRLNCLEKFGGFWIPPAAESDLLRLMLLQNHGGVWADSTMLCRRPLDDWLPEAAASGFFAFAPEKVDPKDNIPVMSSFLASIPDHTLVSHWLERVKVHWRTPIATRPDLGFFWVHVIFGQMVSGTTGADDEMAQEWQGVPRVTGEYGVRGPHYFVPYTDRLRPPPTEEFLQAIESDRETPMWKLTNHEVKLADVSRDSCYWVLLEETRRQARECRANLGGTAHQLTQSSESQGQLPGQSSDPMVRRLLHPGNDVGCY